MEMRTLTSGYYYIFYTLTWRFEYAQTVAFALSHSLWKANSSGDIKRIAIIKLTFRWKIHSKVIINNQAAARRQRRACNLT